MKKYLFFVFVLLVTISNYAQSSGISYQALIINPNGEELPGVNNINAPLSNTAICLKFSFVDGSSQLEYAEVIQTSTDQFGMVNLVIGTGNFIGGYADSWEGIDWSNSNKRLVVELDITNSCSSFELISDQILTAVPYALYSPSSDIPGPPGETGESAYEVWLSLGNTGTEQEFIDSLSGPPGETGESAYEVWLSLGNTGTEQDFINSLTGPQGPTGLIANGTEVGNTLYWDGSKWVTDSNNLYNDGSNILIGTTTVETSSILTIESTTQGILIPKMTLEERDAINSPATGLLIFQTDNTSGFYYYNGSEWTNLEKQFSGNSSSSANTLIYTVNGF